MTRPAGSGDASDEPHDAPRPPDLRLIPAALTSWAVVILALLAGPVLAAALTAMAALGAGVAGRRCYRGSAGRLTAGLLIASGAAAATGLVATAQLALVAGHPVRQAAASRSAVTVRSSSARSRRRSAVPGSPAASPAWSRSSCRPGCSRRRLATSVGTAVDVPC